VILYELTTGKPPFQGDTLPVLFREIMQDTPIEPKKEDSGVPQLLSGLIMKSLNKRPEKRFQTGRDMAQELKACHKRRGSDILGEKRPHEKRRYLALKTLAVSVAICILSIIFYFFSSEKEPRALLKVTSSVMGAEVFINGSYRDRVPLEIELPLNKYEVSVRLKDYYDYKAQVTLDKEGEEYSVFARLFPQEE
jgi:serine/threonine protein kinase